MEDSAEVMLSSALEPIDTLLKRTLEKTIQSGCPPLFAQALQWAVFPGGARVRPRLCLSVTMACTAPDDVNAARQSLRRSCVAGSALELLHCASLVHDDLPCFDDAALRRGRASVQARFGQRLAVLTGDALIVHAFELLACELSDEPAAAGELSLVLARGVGACSGISAGQAWECEPEIDLSVYQRAKTGALFAAATQCGALAAGVSEHKMWRELGNRLGEAFQVADDILDAAGRESDTGKPVGQDARLARPNAVETLGLNGAVKRLRELVEQAVDATPACPGRAALQETIRGEANQLLPAHLAECAA